MTYWNILMIVCFTLNGVFLFEAFMNREPWYVKGVLTLGMLGAIVALR